MPLARQHKWVGIWLEQIYKHLLTQELSEKSQAIFFENYRRILSWLQDPLSLETSSLDQRLLLEFVSDRFHAHQKQTELGLSESEFLPKVIQGDDLSDEPWKAVIPYQIALDRFRSAFNVGSIFRIADAVGFQQVLLGGTTPGKENSQVSKTSMGSTNWIPEKKCLHLAAHLKAECEQGLPIIGIETVEGAVNHTEYPWPQQGILCFGNEEYGLSQEMLGICTDFVQIPMSGRKNSINAANAVAVIAFHIANVLQQGNKSC